MYTNVYMYVCGGGGVEGDVDLHKREEYEWNRVEYPLQSTRGKVIFVEEEQSNEIDDE